MSRPRFRVATALTAAAATVAALAAASPAVAARPDAPAAPACSPEISAEVNTALTERFDTYGDTAGEWTGADSAYSVPLPDGTTAWLYSDTFLGEVDDAGGRPEDSPFIHNSIITDDGASLSTHTGGSAQDPQSLVSVPGGDGSDSWYWFGDGTVEGTTLQVFLLEFARTGDGVFDFAFTGSAIASIDTRDFTVTAITPVPTDGVNWGSAIYENPGDGYTYVYGVEDLGAEKYAHLARVRTGELTTGSWEYRGEHGWTADHAASARLLEGVSNEFSVTRHQGRYTIVTGDARESLSADIVMYRSENLDGPFGPPELLYSTPETGGNIFTYNAKAHPQLGDGHTLAVSYNVNSFDTDDLYEDVDTYRPRYLDVTAKIPNGAPCTG